jgi:hypothetical protein
MPASFETRILSVLEKESYLIPQSLLPLPLDRKVAVGLLVVIEYTYAIDYMHRYVLSQMSEGLIPQQRLTRDDVRNYFKELVDELDQILKEFGFEWGMIIEYAREHPNDFHL